jgi:hypothetical protein
MPNTLTNLTPTIYEALDIVSREQIGYIAAASRDVAAERAALNQSILVPITPPPTLANNVAAVSAPDTGDQTIGNVSMAITKSRHAPIRWNGEEQRGLLNAGSYNGILLNQFVQAFRALGNEMEVDLHNAAYRNSSRAVGLAGTAPFGTAGDLADIANVRRVLDDNGAPQSDLKIVLGSAAIANLRGKQSVLFKVNESGTESLLREGVIGRLEGFDVHNSLAPVVHTKGTGASYVTSGATAPGVSSIALVTGTNTVLAGDTVTFAADAVNRYVVQTGVAAPGTIVLGAPGALVTIPTANALTVGNNYTPNMAFSKSALMLIARPPAMPIGPDGRAMDMADDTMLVTDPVTGITFEIAVYRQFMQLVYHVRLAWGAQAIKPNHIATLMG